MEIVKTWLSVCNKQISMVYLTKDNEYWIVYPGVFPGIYKVNKDRAFEIIEGFEKEMKELEKPKKRGWFTSWFR